MSGSKVYFKIILTFILFIISLKPILGQFSDRHIYEFYYLDLCKSLKYSDIDEDGIKDFLYIDDDESVGYIKNYGNDSISSMMEITGILELGQAKDCHHGDINADGIKDLVYINYNQVYWQKGLGNGNFENKDTLYSTGPSNMLALELIDFDHDGDIDILKAGSGITLIENIGDSVYVSQELFNSLAEDFIVIDADNDGDYDIVGISNSSVLLYTNDQGQFSVTLQSVSLGGDIMSLDIDQDDTLEVIVNSGSDGLVWFDLIGGELSSANVIYDYFFENSFYPNIELADMDLDGDLDIVSSYGGRIDWFENLDNGTISSTPNYIALESEESSELICADIDNDGDIDIMSTLHVDAGLNNWSLGLYENETLGRVDVEGRVFVDVNNNQVHDSVDIGINNMSVQSSPFSLSTYTFSDGNYYMSFSDSAGSYTISPQVNPLWSLNTASSSYNVQISNNNYLTDSLDFGFVPNQLVDSATIDITGSYPRCDQINSLWFEVENTGSTISKGIIKLELDDSLTFINSDNVPDSIVGNTLYWSIDSLVYFGKEHHLIQVQMPNYLSTGNTLTSDLTYFVSNESGVIVDTVSKDLKQVVLCSYDPNDKIAIPQGMDNEGYIISSTEKIEYTIRFQNTGNDTAYNVTINDFIDQNLVTSSFNFVSSSHSVYTTISEQGEVEFFFENIMLPDSSTNFDDSQGYVKFTIQLKPNLSEGTEINNTGYIYFDANPAIVTNTKTHTIFDCADFSSLISSNDSNLCLNSSWNGFIDSTATAVPYTYTWNIDSMMYDQAGITSVMDSVGSFEIGLNIENLYCSYDTLFTVEVNDKPIVHISNPDTVCINHTIQFDLLPEGGELLDEQGSPITDFIPLNYDVGPHEVYYEYTDSNGCSSVDTSLIIVENCLGLEDYKSNRVIKIHPNPVNKGDDFNISIESKESRNVNINVIDVTGKVVNAVGSKTLTTGKNTVSVESEALQAGIYFVKISAENNEFTSTVKMIVK